MKKQLLLLGCVMMCLAVLVGCGSSGDGSDDQADQVDLTAFYDTLAEKYEWGENYMTELTDEMLDGYYPGLGDYTLKQEVIRVPAMSSVVNEIALVECENEDDAEKVEELFQKRVDDQAEGGAWYPESMAAWSEAEVIRHGSYVALLASAEHQSELSDEFNALFAG